MASCAICLDEDAKKEFLVTDCNHIFHMECLLQTKEINKNIIIVEYSNILFNPQ